MKDLPLEQYNILSEIDSNDVFQSGYFLMMLEKFIIKTINFVKSFSSELNIVQIEMMKSYFNKSNIKYSLRTYNLNNLIFY